MDTTELSRLVGSLRTLAQRGSWIPESLYSDLRTRVIATLDDAGDLDGLLPPASNLPLDGQNHVLGGGIYVAAGTAYLEEMLAEQGAGGPRALAATDLMEQVQVLLDDEAVHQAAPTVLAGAALEEVLRELVEANDIAVDGRPGLTTYAQALYREGRIDRGTLKDVVSIAEVRNDAAHGRFEKVSLDRARVLVGQVNELLSQLRQPDALEQDDQP